MVYIRWRKYSILKLNLQLFIEANTVTNVYNMKQIFFSVKINWSQENTAYSLQWFFITELYYNSK